MVRWQRLLLSIAIDIFPDAMARAWFSGVRMERRHNQKRGGGWLVSVHRDVFERGPLLFADLPSRAFPKDGEKIRWHAPPVDGGSRYRRSSRIVGRVPSAGETHRF